LHSAHTGWFSAAALTGAQRAYEPVLNRARYVAETSLVVLSLAAIGVPSSVVRVLSRFLADIGLLSAKWIEPLDGSAHHGPSFYTEGLLDRTPIGPLWNRLVRGFARSMRSE
jgi:hypothetical protein